MKRLLFDYILFFKIAQKEHDYFAETLKKRCGNIIY
ncbi:MULTISPECIES: arginine deiminase family protein [Lactobacillus]